MMFISYIYALFSAVIKLGEDGMRNDGVIVFSRDDGGVSKKNGTPYGHKKTKKKRKVLKRKKRKFIK